MMYVVWIQEHGLHTEQHKTNNMQHIETYNIQEAKEHKDSDMDEAQEGMNKNMQ